ncbi:hypothetical protein [Streptomyces parvus]|uniref:hypothetical protein n=1 Tax=Streptomyces parvus TaxID=66428 RepID=UPI0035D74103
MDGPDVTDLPPVPVAEDGTFVLEDILPDQAEDVFYVLGYAGDEVHYRTEHWLHLNTVEESNTVRRGRR